MKRFNIYVAMLSLILDGLALFAGLVLAYQIRAQGGELFAWPFATYLKLTAIMIPVWLALLASQRLYSVRSAPHGWNILPRLLIGLMAGWAVMIIVFYFWRNTAAENFPRLVIVYGVVLTVGLALLGKFLIDILIQSAHRLGLGLTKTVVIAGSNHQPFIKAMEHERRQSGRQLLAVLQSADVDQLDSLKKQGLDEIVVASALSEETLLKTLDWAEAAGISFVTVPSLMSVRATNVEAGSLAGTTVMFFRRSPLEGWGKVFKRLLDLIIVIPAIIILSPVYLILAILVKLSSPGPVIYKEARVGQDGREFFVGKFRSMYSDWRARFPGIQDWSADEATDVRITPVGRITRKTNIDEIPQLWDVLKGKMSLVGPRPEQPRYVEKFAAEVPDYLRRHYVKSGLTGWAQINGARGNTPVAERVKYDLYYIENWSLWFDVRIILATFVYLFRQVARSK